MNASISVPSAANFASIVRERPREQKLTQEDLAQKVGKSRKWVADVELSKTMPTLPAVIAVAEALGYTLTLREHEGADIDILANVLGEG